MTNGSTDELTKVLKAMVDVEVALADLYRACAQTWEGDAVFWSALSAEEIHHTESVRKLAGLIARKTDKEQRFEFHRPITVQSIQTFLAGIKQQAQRVRQGAISEKKMLAIALDIERSVMERKYSEIVKTDDVEYQTVASAIDDQTAAHVARLEKKMADQRG